MCAHGLISQRSPYTNCYQCHLDCRSDNMLGRLEKCLVADCHGAEEIHLPSWDIPDDETTWKYTPFVCSHCVDEWKSWRDGVARQTKAVKIHYWFDQILIQENFIKFVKLLESCDVKMEIDYTYKSVWHYVRNRIN